MSDADRYYQPTDIKDALTKIQDLFNSYVNEPLTNELLAYHQKLIQQLQTNLLPIAQQNNESLRVQQINSMVAAMQDWVKIKLNNRPYNGRLKHFKYVADRDRPAFKQRVHKIKGSQSHRGTRH